MDAKETFFEQYWDQEIDNDELNTILIQATQYADALRGTQAFQAFPREDAHTMALSIGVTRAILERYESYKDRHN